MLSAETSAEVGRMVHARLGDVPTPPCLKKWIRGNKGDAYREALLQTLFMHGLLVDGVATNFSKSSNRIPTPLSRDTVLGSCVALQRALRASRVALSLRNDTVVVAGADCDPHAMAEYMSDHRWFALEFAGKTPNADRKLFERFDPAGMPKPSAKKQRVSTTSDKAPTPTSYIASDIQDFDDVQWKAFRSFIEEVRTSGPGSGLKARPGIIATLAFEEASPLGEARLRELRSLDFGMVKWPSLSERREDLCFLFEAYAADPARELTEDACRFIADFDWTGDKQLERDPVTLKRIRS
jgi:hypothetical protein